MSGSDFLLITAPDWTEVQNATVLVRTMMDEQHMANLIASDDWGPVTQWGEDVGLLQPGQQIIDARLFDLGAGPGGEPNFRFWIVKQSS